MKAVVLNGPNDFTAVEDYPKPQIGPRDMLLEMKRTAICGTDIRILEGKRQRMCATDTLSDMRSAA